MKYLSKVLPLIGLLLVNVTVALAQAPPPSTNPPGAPLDAIVGALLVGGAVYGVRRMKKNNDADA
ncbi:hypothetical protein OAE48_05140 [Flavobacteriales bacterium]|nr:hypothetical protein [Flavobacteriales bacterium]